MKIAKDWKLQNNWWNEERESVFQKYFAYKGSSLRDVTQKYLCGGHNTKIMYIIIQILRKGASIWLFIKTIKGNQISPNMEEETSSTGSQQENIRK